MAVITLPNNYGYVLLCATIMGLSCLLVGFIFAGKKRSSVFTQKYMKENFGAEHRRVTGTDIKAGGYPDTGSGFYSKNLTYEQWYDFNNGQRAHMNFVEWIASTLIFLLIGGLYYPIVAASIGLATIIARFVYAAGYSHGGPSSRLVGVLMNDLCVLALFILSMISSIKFISGDSFV